MMRRCGNIVALALLTAAAAGASDAAAALRITPVVVPPTAAGAVLVASDDPPVPEVLAPPDQCGAEIKIVQATPLQFGAISVEPGSGGVVIVSPNGAVATLGGIAVGPAAGPAIIRVCGPADEEFQMVIDPTQLDLTAANIGARPHMAHDLEATISGGEIHPTGDGQWEGVLGPRGSAEIRIGGTLTVPAGESAGKFAAPFRIRIDKLH